MGDVPTQVVLGVVLVIFGAIMFYGWIRRDQLQAAHDARHPPAPPEPPLEALASEEHHSLIRLYRGATQEAALRPFMDEARLLDRYGYRPTSQSWAQGQWGWQAFAAAVLLFIFVIGIIVFIYLVVVKPDGTLTVTYERGSQPAASQQGPMSRPAAPDTTLAARLSQLDEARRAGLISDQEYAAKRQEMLSGF